MTPRDHQTIEGVSFGNLIALVESLLGLLLESPDHPALAPFLADWPASASLADSAKLPLAPAPLPVLRWLPQIAAGAHGFGAPLVTAACRAAPSLAWHQSYGRDEASAGFVENYGWTEILGPRGLGVGGKITCGLLLLGPNTLYPRHRHL